MQNLQDLLGLHTKQQEPVVEVWKVSKSKFDMNEWRTRIQEHAIRQTKLSNGIVAPEFHFYSPLNISSADHVTVGLVKMYMFADNPVASAIVGQAIPQFVEQVQAEAVVIVTGASSGTVEVKGATNEEMMGEVLEKAQAGEVTMTPCLFLQFETANECEIKGFEIEAGGETIVTPIEDVQMPAEIPHLLYMDRKDEN